MPLHTDPFASFCRRVLASGLIALGGGGTLLAALEAEVVPEAEDNFYEARTRLWLPPSPEPLRGVLVVIGGTDQDWRHQADSKFWRAIAGENHLALVGCYFRGDGEPYEDAAKGSGVALLRMIADLAAQSARPELKNLPIFFVGHSAGAMFSYNFVCWSPERCGGFVSSKSGPISATHNTAAFQVPGLFILGEYDDFRRTESIVTALAARPSNAKWTIAIEPEGRHGFSAIEKDFIESYVSTLSRHPAQQMKESCFSSLLDPSSTSSEPPPGAERAWLPDTHFHKAWASFTASTSLERLVANAGDKQSEPLSVLPGAIDMGSVDLDLGAPPILRKIVPITGINFDLNKAHLLTESPGLKASLKISDKNRKSALEISLDTSQLPSARYRGTLYILPQGFTLSDSPPQVQITARLFSEIKVTPESLYLGTIRRGNIIERHVLLESRSAEPFKILKVRFSRKFGTLSQSPFGKGVQLLFRFDACELGNQSGHCDLILDRSTHPVRITFIAWVERAGPHSTQKSLE